ncbi:MAG: hypothetical protein KDN20_22145 [Verrucomicrobiae bacterium]|nr:hypothetical protein [Verrucomicrobiae bacterium]
MRKLRDLFSHELDRLKTVALRSMKPAAITALLVWLAYGGHEKLEYLFGKIGSGIVAVGGYWTFIAVAVAGFALVNPVPFRRFYNSLMLHPEEFRIAVIACPILVLANLVSFVIASALNPILLILLFLACYHSFSREEKESEPVEDTLRRNYFVDRLCEIFSFPDPDFKRIAILGDWGAGKTRILDLLWKRLGESGEGEFRVAFVNPWKARTPEAAMAALSRGFDEALALDRTLEWSGLFRWLRPIVKSLPNVGKLGDEVLKLFEGESSGGERKRLQWINRQLRNANAKVVILVDDMERAEPEVVRRMFPVIAELDEFEQCYFVFAIDPERVAKAFDEVSGLRSETKGYLDKVFDLQISLPDPSLRDVQRWIRKLVSEEEFPKFHASIAGIDEYLPRNPRSFLKFVKDAKTKEALFLGRYGPEEHLYVPFFLVQMLDVELPGIGRVLVRRQDQLKRSGAKDEGVFDFLDEKGEEDQATELEKLVNELQSEFQVSELAATERIRLETLLRGIVKRARRDVDTLLRDETSPFDIQWCIDDFKTLTSISLSERLAFSNEWLDQAGKMSLSEVLARSQSGRQFDDIERCANEMLVERIKLAKRLIGAAWRAPDDDEQAKLIRMAEGVAIQFQHHIDFLINSSVELDRRVFGDAVFSEWSKLALDTYDNGQSGNRDLWDELSRSIDSVFSGLVKFVPIEKCYQYSQPDGFRVFARNRLGEEVVKKEKVRFDEFRNAFEERVFNEFRNLFNERNVIDDWPSWLEHRGWNLLYDPKAWLGHSDIWKSRFEKLIDDAKFSEAVQSNFLRIVELLFLHPLTCGADHDHAEQKRWIKKLAEEHPGYIRGFWDGARRRGKFPDTQERILAMRQRAIELENWADKAPESELDPGMDFFDQSEVLSLFPLSEKESKEKYDAP